MDHLIEEMKELRLIVVDSDDQEYQPAKTAHHKSLFGNTDEVPAYINNTINIIFHEKCIVVEE